MTAFIGYGSQPPLKVVQKLAKQANFSNWNQAKQVIMRIVDSVQSWSELAKNLDINPKTQKLIGKQLDETWRANKRLI